MLYIGISIYAVGLTQAINSRILREKINIFTFSPKPHRTNLKTLSSLFKLLTASGHLMTLYLH
jgi:hypothetical protein